EASPRARHAPVRRRTPSAQRVVEFPAGFARADAPSHSWSLGARSARPSEASGVWGPRQALLAGGEGRSPVLKVKLGVREQLLYPTHVLPLPCPFLRDHPRRRPTHRQLLADALEVEALVLSGLVQLAMSTEPLLGDGVELAGELEHLDAAEASMKRL